MEWLRRWWRLDLGARAGIGCGVLFLLFLPIAWLGKTIQGGGSTPPSRSWATDPTATVRPRPEPPRATATATTSITSKPAARPSSADGVPGFVTKKGYLAGATKEALDKAITLLAQNDNKAFEALLATGAVFPLQEGIEVVAVDADGLLSGVAKVRKRGTLTEFWTVREALEAR